MLSRLPCGTPWSPPSFLFLHGQAEHSPGDIVCELSPIRLDGDDVLSQLLVDQRGRKVFDVGFDLMSGSDDVRPVVHVPFPL